MDDGVSLELGRLRRQLNSAERVDPVDVAAVEALASEEVQNLLVPILKLGAVLCGITLLDCVASTTFACIAFETQWQASSVHLSPPPVVTALVDLAPPRVRKAAKVTRSLDVASVMEPEGPTPVIMRQLGRPSPAEAQEFVEVASTAFDDWRQRAGVSASLPTYDSSLRQDLKESKVAAKAKARGGACTMVGTHCTGAMCIEHTSDYCRID